jgi:hypothetical protein
MKAFTRLLVLLTTGLSGCMAIENRPAIRDNGGMQVLSEQDSLPSARPLAVRWQNLMLMMRPNPPRRGGFQSPTAAEADEMPDQGTAQVAEMKSSPETPSSAIVLTAATLPAAKESPKNISSPLQAKALNTAKPSEGVSSAVPQVPSENPGVNSADKGDSPLPTPKVRAVNSKRIVLDYEVKDVGPSGVSAVDVWFTRDGRRWEKCESGAQRTSPYVLQVKEEGLYGITLVACSGIGLKKRPPRPGDAPQIWIDVDQTKPIVRLTGCEVGIGPDAQNLTIRWKATDKNFGPQPITLSYAEQPDGPWSTIASNVENTGSYVWKMPSSVPQRLLLRVEAADLAGNVSIVQTRKPLLIDLAMPTVSIIDVHAAAN